MSGGSGEIPASRPERRLIPCAVVHAEILGSLLEACFDDSWRSKDLREILAMPGAFGFLLEESGSPVGFVLCQLGADEMTVLSLGVLPERRKAGLAALLIKAAEERASGLGATTAFLEVAEDNAVARRLYARRGYVEVGKRQNYYKGSVGRRIDALILRRRLTATEPR